jgi:hypothetical protein
MPAYVFSRVLKVLPFFDRLQPDAAGFLIIFAAVFL